MRDEVVAAMRENGQPWKAAYLEKFGLPLNPWFTHLNSVKEQEAFYRMCVQANEPWHYFRKPPNWNRVTL